MLVLFEASHNIFQSNPWSMFLVKCLAGSELWFGLLCSAHLISTLRFVCPIYFIPHLHSPSYILHEGWGFLSFNGKSDLTCFVFHFIAMLKQEFVKLWNFIKNVFDFASFNSQKGSSNYIKQGSQHSGKTWKIREKIGKFQNSGKTWKTQGILLENWKTQGNSGKFFYS